MVGEADAGVSDQSVEGGTNPTVESRAGSQAQVRFRQRGARTRRGHRQSDAQQGPGGAGQGPIVIRPGARVLVHAGPIDILASLERLHPGLPFAIL